jgi:hypothetical protein
MRLISLFSRHDYYFVFKGDSRRTLHSGQNDHHDDEHRNKDQLKATKHVLEFAKPLKITCQY